jgi:hypothetical protein
VRSSLDILLGVWGAVIVAAKWMSEVSEAG